MIEFTQEKHEDFEIILIDRDGEGNPTGKKSSYASDDASKIAEFHERHEAIMASKVRKFKKGQRKGNKNKRK